MLTSNNIPMYVVAQALIFHKESASTNKLHYIKEYKYASIEATMNARFYEPLSHKARFSYCLMVSNISQ